MKDDIIKMARKAGGSMLHDGEFALFGGGRIENFAALVAAAERNKIAAWMMTKGYATGHGDTTEDLLEELDWQITESWSKVVTASVRAEREECARLCENMGAEGYGTLAIAAAMRRRGQV